MTWIVTSATPPGKATDATVALGGQGSYITGSATGDVDFYQLTDVIGYDPYRLSATLSWYARNYNGSTKDILTVQLFALDGEGLVLNTQTYGPITQSNTLWARNELNITNLPLGTVQLKTRIFFDSNVVSLAEIAITEIQLHVGQYTADLLTNGNFAAGTLAGWTQSNSWQILTTTKYEETSYARPNDGASDSIMQHPAVTAGFEHGTAVLEFANMHDADGGDTGYVELSAHSGSGDSQIGQLAQVTMDALGTKNIWTRYRLHLQLPEGTVYVQVKAYATRVAGSPLNVCYDDFRLRIYKDLASDGMDLTITFDTPAIQYLPQTVRDWERRFPSIPAPDYGFWNGASLQGVLGNEPEMTTIDLETGLPGNAIPATCFVGGPWDEDDTIVTDAIDFGLGSIAVDAGLRANDQSYANFDRTQPFTVLVVYRCFGVVDYDGLIGHVSPDQGIGWAVMLQSDGSVYAELGNRDLSGTVPQTHGSPTFVALAFNPDISLDLVTPDEVASISPVGMSEISSTNAFLEIGNVTATPPDLATGAIPSLSGQIARIYIWQQTISVAQLQSFWTYGSDVDSLVSDYTRDNVLGVLIGDDDGAVVGTVAEGRLPWVSRGALDGWGLLVNRDITNRFAGSNITSFISTADNPFTYSRRDPAATITQGSAGAERRRNGGSIVIEGDLERGWSTSLITLPAGSPNVMVQWHARGGDENTTQGRLVLENQSGEYVDHYDFDLTEELQGYSHLFEKWRDGIFGTSLVVSEIIGGWGFSGASSCEYIAGDGYVQARITDLSSYRFLALTATDVDADYVNLEFALYTYAATNTLYVYELNGSQFSVGTPYVVGDVVKIDRTGTTIKYYKNGVLLYTSGLTSKGPLVVDVAFNVYLDRIDDVRLVDSGAERAIHWQRLFKVIVDRTQSVPLGTQTCRLHWYPSTSVSRLGPPGAIPFSLDGTSDVDGTDYAMELSLPIQVTQQTWVPNCFAMAPDTATITAPAIRLPVSSFIKQFNHEGEFIVEALLEETSPTDATILKLTTNAADKDTRSFGIESYNPVFDHYDGSAVAVRSTGNPIDWTTSWAIRGRWCRAGLIEEIGKYAGIMDEEHTWSLFYPPLPPPALPLPALPTYGRTATWSVGTPEAVISTVAINPNGDWQGILRRVTFTSREEKLP